MRFSNVALALGLLVGLWLLLTDGDPASWVIGVPAIAAATWTVMRLNAVNEGGMSVSGLLLFVPFFLWESLRGGTDVALRTLAPRMRIRPGFAVYQTRLQRLDARVLFANCVSLLPGSLAADLRGHRLDVHVLDVRADPTTQLGRLERAVERIFSRGERTLEALS